MAVELHSTASKLAHIFRDAEGHLPDTPEGHALLLATANDPAFPARPDRFGNPWAAGLLPDGMQVWTRAGNGTIINGGVNVVPRIFHLETGLNRYE